ncbi:PREDICTED: probable LRR receptor-like serine/threonine-protein kinase At3g47570 [Nelumbo nucifera]|uniref:non-specific serine/threonine protein kinase n=2 Tax=Nelumbo nucifera TaxID=4432 RepID=A0A1U7ZQN0_NELNU|nr:PREDICTED: probable LRR receptor-like serine/threonine-protein kinase At3g47570 [Nelumbo nucifera]DAD39287.1 TPA_asm: hypothetical protein HUJ06_013610 [Nelumbo nucifera]
MSSSLLRLSIYVFFLLFASLLGLEVSTLTIATSLGNETDRLALLGFKNNHIYDPLGALNSWNESLHFCKWKGVTCGRKHQRITFLDLSDNRLEGILPPYIGNLTFLRGIYLSNNGFHGTIPQEIGRLFRLQFLNLSTNFLQGEIPTNLTRCHDLRVLDIRKNNLTGRIPNELGSLSKLTQMFLSKNSLTGRIPHSFGNLSSLEDLRISYNALEGNIPESMGQMTRLKTVVFDENKLSGTFPCSFYNISSIELFYATSNQLHGRLPADIDLTLPNLQQIGIACNHFTGRIPQSLSNISGLTLIDISSNNFLGPVPANLGNLQYLSTLDIGGNRLGTREANHLRFLTSLTNCTSLAYLELYENDLRGPFPNSITNLSTQLTRLIMNGNQISGSIPVGIENLINLNYLDMSFNFLTGSIPPTIGKLRKLEVLFLQRNRFVGEIPPSICNITPLYNLHLEENRLHGKIPSCLGDSISLQQLNLSYNKLTGVVPKQLIGLSSLTFYLNLEHNSLSGSLPPEVVKLKYIEQLAVFGNKLSGEIPAALGACSSLRYLYLGANFFHGNIPSSLSLLRAIEVLDLSLNNLSGLIPKEFENLPFLESLDLSVNNLEGEVPTEGVFANLSKINVVGNSRLCGGIPELQLPSCSTSMKGGKPIGFKVLVVVVSVVFSFILSWSILYWIRKPKRESSPTPPIGDRQLKVSYTELFQATDGFSEANLIGSGGSGCVYKGNLINRGESETVVAIKVFSLQQPRALMKSFMAECNILKNIRHRNIVKIITSCSSMDSKSNDFKALVFEFMPNGSLEKWLHPDVDLHKEVKTSNILQRLNIAIDVASALDYLHYHCETPIIHCDLKPSNILLDDDLTAHVSDFGSARLLAEGTNNFSCNTSGSSAVKGSIGYMAPEYGTSGEVAIHGDVYSYGILLLEMFTGKRPTHEMFTGDFNLHKFAKMALPQHVMKIVDSRLISNEEHVKENTSINYSSYRTHMVDKLQVCLTWVIRIGVQCSIATPRERMNIRVVTKELNLIREVFLGVKVHGVRPNYSIEGMVKL